MTVNSNSYFFTTELDALTGCQKKTKQVGINKGQNKKYKKELITQSSKGFHCA